MKGSQKVINSIKERLGREDEGFTLIELMVVVLIIAILLAIAIPTFLGARNSANARSAQSNLRNALTAEQSYYTNNQAFDTTGATVSSSETALTFVSSGPTTPGKTVLVTAPASGIDGVILSAAAKDGNCYAIEVINQGSGSIAAGTYYQEYAATSGTSGSTTSCGAPSAGVAGAVTQPNANNPTGNWALAF